jgi:2-polyprenyl-3-methyl-5-hydroxy-6-metoxy-1,4-benzoquinol methylase
MGRLLDVGCGSGAYLARMQQLGWEVVGVERAVRMAEQIRTRLGIPVVAAGLPSNDLPVGHFDLVTAWQVLEHMERPRQALACIRKLLRAGGRLALTVPNQSGWAARWFGPAWVGLDLPRHLVHFTPATLARMLESEGFSVVHQTTIGSSGWIRKSARLGGPLHQRVFALKSLSRLASAYACHQAAGESIYVIAQLERSS